MLASEIQFGDWTPPVTVRRLTEDGQAAYTSMMRENHTLFRHTLARDADPRAPDAGWWRLGFVKEIQCDIHKADPSGQLYGNGCPMPLIIVITENNCGYGPRVRGPHGKKGNVKLTSGSCVNGPFLNRLLAKMGAGKKNTTPEAKAARNLRRRKIEEYREYKHWPWWVKHDGEKIYWSDTTRKNYWYDAARWRLSRDFWLDKNGPPLTGRYEGMTRQAALALYEKDWVDMYGQDEHKKAMKATEQAYRWAKSEYGNYHDFKADNPPPKSDD